MPVTLFGDPGALAPSRTLREDLGQGRFVLRHPEPLQPYARCVGDWLEHWALTTPDANFLSERAADGSWRRMSYGEVRRAVGRIAEGLIERCPDADKPVVILSDNSIDHALLSLAAMHLGRTSCSVSSAYSRLTRDYTKIRTILDALDPALVYAADPAVYGPAIAAWGGKVPVVFGRDAGSVPGALPFESLALADETGAVMRAFAAIRPDHHAKYLLTSGSTGKPKVVINTHRMLCANQQQMTQVWPFLMHEPLVLLDWLPWSHTFGANHNFHMALAHGGSLAIDEGRPAPGLVEKTVRNLREVKPNVYFNVPRGYDMLLPFLERDEALAREVFERLEVVFYAAAALPQSLWERLQAVAARARPTPVWFTSSWGATETAPALTNVHWHIERAGCIGAPLPGVELKFVPNAGKLEMRVRGPNVFPGYRHAPELAAQVFDEDGYYLIGDAGKLVDASQPDKGVVFDGRVAEDFKLSSGTWVSVGMLRTRAVSALDPIAADVVVTGHDRDEVGLLIFPSPLAKDVSPEELQSRIREALRALHADGGGSSQSPTRALVLTDPPSIDHGEITDKGYINQRAVLTRRAEHVGALYATAPGFHVIRL